MKRLGVGGVLLLFAVVACTIPEARIPRVPSERVVAVAKENGGTFDLPIANLGAMEALQGMDVTPPPTLRILSLDADARRRVTARFAAENFEVSPASGQRVFVWLDAEPRAVLSDLSDPVVFEEVAAGRHVVTAVLVRPYYVHLKNPEATAEALFSAGEARANEGIEADAPLLLYAVPRGTYSLRDGSAQNILLDFHLRNAVLGALTYRVRYWVDGVYRGDLLAHKPEVILENPSPGEHAVRLELRDRFNRRVAAPGNPATGTFRVE